MHFPLQLRGGAEIADPDVQVAQVASKLESADPSLDNFLPNRRGGGEGVEKGVLDQQANTGTAL